MEPDDYLLPIVSLVLIILFIIWGIWYYFTERGSIITVNTKNFVCPIGQCATNVFSGVKTCPENSSSAVQFNPGEEVCNPPNQCLDPQTPYALDPNFGTNLTGFCTTDQCQCLSESQCPNYITAYFQTNEGQPWAPLTDSRFSLFQQTSFVDSAGVVRDNPPYTFPLNGLTFCTVPFQWIGRIYPRQCKSGTLAVLTTDPNQISLDNVAQNPLGCVVGSPCGISGTAVFDTSAQTLSCQPLCPTGEQPRWDEENGTVVCQADN